MYRNRCRPRYSEKELKEIYSRPWSMKPDWKDHILRQNATLLLADRLIDDNDTTAADLSCGDAYYSYHIPNLIWTLGDYASGYEYRGPIEQTIERIKPVDIFFCCETLEHLDNPEQVLRQIRRKSKKLVVSTPKCSWWDENPEHYWSWDRPAVKKMLMECDWNPIEYEETYSDPGYSFQIWGCV